MSTHDQPDQMMWRFDGYQFVLDEDGLQLRITSRRTGFEQPEVLELIKRYEAIRDGIARGFKAPQPPDREQLRAMGSDWVERRAIEDSISTLRSQLEAKSPDLPF